jgi:hypothetical protein
MGLKRAQAEFNKAGLTVGYKEGDEFPCISVQDPIRWSQVSCIVKVNERLPFTTNSIESLNGHLNEVTPRRNSFWGSLTRLASMIEFGILNYHTSVRHNFNSATRRAQALARAIGDTEMLKQRIYYHTTIDHNDSTCDCHLSTYFSEVYGQFVPCCHMLEAGVARPVMRVPPNLIYSDDQSFYLTIEKGSRPGEEQSHERKDALVELACRSIKQLSRTGKGLDDIRRWVTENFPPTDSLNEFVLNIPLAVLDLISAGVNNFKGIRDTEDDDIETEVAD